MSIAAIFEEVYDCCTLVSAWSGLSYICHVCAPCFRKT